MKKVTKFVIVEMTKLQKIVKKGYDGDQITNTSNANPSNAGHENTSGQGQQQSGGKKSK